MNLITYTHYFFIFSVGAVKGTHLMPADKRFIACFDLLKFWEGVARLLDQLL